jgi:type I restriction enzyme S subunit
MTLALNRDQARLVRQILDRELPGAQVAVFGSRATGKSRPFSDLDLLLVEPPALSWPQRARLREAFDESELPFKVDITEAADLGEGVAARARQEQVPLP